MTSRPNIPFHVIGKGLLDKMLVRCSRVGNVCIWVGNVSCLERLFRGVLDYIGVPLCECICAQYIHYLENACCELALQDSLYHKKASSFTSNKDVLRREVERENRREGMVRKRATERGRGEKQTSSIRYPAMTVSIWNLLQFMSGWIQ